MLYLVVNQQSLPLSDNMDEDKKPDHINIKVQGMVAVFLFQDGSEVFFKIKKTTALKKLMDAYCEKQGKHVSSLRFLFDGKQIFPNDTPDKVTVSHLIQLGLDNEDIIEARLEQTGGFF